jgi:hypothetical protein
VEPSKSTALRPTLEPTPGLSAVLDAAARATTPKALDSDMAPPEVGTLAEQLGARYVVLAAVTKDRKGRLGAQLHAWDSQTKSRLRKVELKPGDLRSQQKAVDQVHDFVTGKLVPTPSKPLAMPTVLKKPWFWAAVGGVAAATTAGFLLATQERPKPLLGGRLGNPGAGW